MKYIIIALLLIGLSVRGQSVADSIWKHNIQSGNPYPPGASCAVYRGEWLDKPNIDTIRINPDTVHYKWIGHDKIILYGSDMDTFRLTNPTPIKKNKKPHRVELVLSSSGTMAFDTIRRGENGMGITPQTKSWATAIPINIVTVQEPYPWWKKALWMVVGMVVLCIGVFLVALFGEAKKD